MGEKIFKLKAMIMLKSAKIDENMFPEKKKWESNIWFYFQEWRRWLERHPTLLALYYYIFWVFDEPSLQVKTLPFRPTGYTNLSS